MAAGVTQTLWLLTDMVRVLEDRRSTEIGRDVGWMKLIHKQTEYEPACPIVVSTT
jgi:hypothetical protein